jgi:hypothetical protein
MAGLIDEHPSDLFSSRLFSPGEYVFDTDDFGDINALFRKSTRTTLQIVHRWGLEAASQQVRDAYTRSNYEVPFQVIEAIEPNVFETEGREDWRGKPYVKFVFEETTLQDDDSRFLQITGDGALGFSPSETQSPSKPSSSAMPKPSKRPSSLHWLRRSNSATSLSPTLQAV